MAAALWRDILPTTKRCCPRGLCRDLRPPSGAGAGRVQGLAGMAGRTACRAGAFRLSPEFLGHGGCLLSAGSLRRPGCARQRGRARVDRGCLCGADANGTPQVYWFTQDFNATARRLYDRVGVGTPFIRYNRRAGETGAPGPGVTIRPVAAADETAWRNLWQDYLTFYETELPEAVTAATFARITSDDPQTMRGLLLEVDGRLRVLSTMSITRPAGRSRR